MTATMSVRENIAGWLAAFNAKDLDALKSFYDPESSYANAAAPMYHGIDAIMGWYEQAFATVTGTLHFREEFLIEEGSMALLVGKYYFAPPSGDPAGAENATGRVALVYRRAPDDRWLLLFDMDNTPPDVGPGDFDVRPATDAWPGRGAAGDRPAQGAQHTETSG